jgi:hypothetical protein
MCTVSSIHRRHDLPNTCAYPASNHRFDAARDRNGDDPGDDLLAASPRDASLDERIAVDIAHADGAVRVRIWVNLAQLQRRALLPMTGPSLVAPVGKAVGRSPVG